MNYPIQTATIIIYGHNGATPYDIMIFGVFLEHFENQIYAGVSMSINLQEKNL